MERENGKSALEGQVRTFRERAEEVKNGSSWAEIKG